MSSKKQPAKSAQAKPSSGKTPTRKQVKFVEGVLEGKSNRRAALDAGYSIHTAKRPSIDILPGIQANFQELMRKFCPPEKIAKTIAAGLDAKQTKATYDSSTGRFVYSKDLVLHGERRAAAELAAKMGALYTPTERTEKPPAADRLDEVIAAMQAGPMPRGSVNKDEEESS